MQPKHRLGDTDKTLGITFPPPLHWPRRRGYRVKLAAVGDWG
jgi:hypothetical protein